MAPNRFQLGVSSYTFPWAIGLPGLEPSVPMSADDLLDRAGQLGVPVVQIADNLPLHARTERELATLRDRAHAKGIQLEVGTRGIDAANIRRYLEIAKLLGSPILRVVVDRGGHEPQPAKIVSLLRQHESTFRRAGITLAIENHDRLSSATLAAIVTELGQEWVGVCLDTVNSLGALEGPDLVIRTLGPMAVNLHVKDFTITRSNATLGFEVRGCPVGAGRLDLDQVLATVGQRLSKISAVIELWTPRQATVEQTIALESAWAKESVATLSRRFQSAGTS